MDKAYEEKDADFENEDAGSFSNSQLLIRENFSIASIGNITSFISMPSKVIQEKLWFDPVWDNVEIPLLPLPRRRCLDLSHVEKTPTKDCRLTSLHPWTSWKMNLTRSIPRKVQFKKQVGNNSGHNLLDQLKQSTR